MKPLAKKASPAAIAVLRQATALWPKRKKASDGLLPSSAHVKQNPNSDHNTGLAVDITHHPAAGVDCATIYQMLQLDKRVEYLIHNGHIWSRERGSRVYTGSNKHEKHLHISIKPEFAKDTSPWFGWMEKPKMKNRITAKLQKKAKKKDIPSPKED